MTRARRPLSLRAQAVAWLSQREHSERELRQKLSRRVQREAAEASDAGTGEGLDAPPDATADIDGVLQWLKDQGYLSDQRFIASRVHVRATRTGTARIQQELSQHGLQLPEDLAQSLRDSEAARARALWQRRFNAAPTGSNDLARQGRFLMSRGFSAEVVRRLLREVSQASAHLGDDMA